MSLTKLAATTAHGLLAAAFFRLQVIGGEFNELIWMIYGGLAIAHASYDKTAAMFKAYKERAPAHQE